MSKENLTKFYLVSFPFFLSHQSTDFDSVFIVTGRVAKNMLAVKVIRLELEPYFRRHMGP